MESLDYNTPRPASVAGRTRPYDFVYPALLTTLVTGTQDILSVGHCTCSPGFGTSKATHGFFNPAGSPGSQYFLSEKHEVSLSSLVTIGDRAIRKKPLTPFEYHQARQLYIVSVVQKRQTAKWLHCFLVSGPQAVSCQSVRIWQVLLECSGSRILQAQAETAETVLPAESGFYFGDM